MSGQPIGKGPAVPTWELKAPKGRSVAPTPVKKVNTKRKGHRFPNNVNEALRTFVRKLKCVLAGLKDGNTGKLHVCRGLVRQCHRIPEGNGKSPDDNNLFPACDLAHQMQEGKTKDFEKRWFGRVGALKAICRQVTANFYREAKHGV